MVRFVSLVPIIATASVFSACRTDQTVRAQEKEAEQVLVFSIDGMRRINGAL